MSDSRNSSKKRDRDEKVEVSPTPTSKKSKHNDGKNYHGSQNIEYTNNKNPQQKYTHSTLLSLLLDYKGDLSTDKDIENFRELCYNHTNEPSIHNIAYRIFGAFQPNNKEERSRYDQDKNLVLKLNNLINYHLDKLGGETGVTKHTLANSNILGRLMVYLHHKDTSDKFQYLHISTVKRTIKHITSTKHDSSQNLKLLVALEKMEHLSVGYLKNEDLEITPTLIATIFPNAAELKQQDFPYFMLALSALLSLTTYNSDYVKIIDEHKLIEAIKFIAYGLEPSRRDQYGRNLTRKNLKRLLRILKEISLSHLKIPRKCLQDYYKIINACLEIHNVGSVVNVAIELYSILLSQQSIDRNQHLQLIPKLIDQYMSRSRHRTPDLTAKLLDIFDDSFKSDNTIEYFDLSEEQLSKLQANIKTLMNEFSNFENITYKNYHFFYKGLLTILQQWDYLLYDVDNDNMQTIIDKTCQFIENDLTINKSNIKDEIGIYNFRRSAIKIITKFLTYTMYNNVKLMHKVDTTRITLVLINILKNLQDDDDLYLWFLNNASEHHTLTMENNTIGESLAKVTLNEDLSNKKRYKTLVATTKLITKYPLVSDLNVIKNLNSIALSIDYHELTFWQLYDVIDSTIQLKKLAPHFDTSAIISKCYSEILSKAGGKGCTLICEKLITLYSLGTDISYLDLNMLLSNLLSITLSELKLKASTSRKYNFTYNYYLNSVEMLISHKLIPLTPGLTVNVLQVIAYTLNQPNFIIGSPIIKQALRFFKIFREDHLLDETALNQFRSYLYQTIQDYPDEQEKKILETLMDITFANATTTQIIASSPETQTVMEIDTINLVDSQNTINSDALLIVTNEVNQPQPHEHKIPSEYGEEDLIKDDTAKAIDKTTTNSSTIFTETMQHVDINLPNFKIDPPVKRYDVHNLEDIKALEKDKAFIYLNTNNKMRFKLSVGPVGVLDKGFGVFAEEDILPNSRPMFEYAGELLSEKDEDINSDYKFPCYDNKNKNQVLVIIDARYQGDFTRFINHSDTPNLIAKERIIREKNKPPRCIIEFYATRPIRKGEQLTFDYKRDIYFKDIGYDAFFINEKTPSETLSQIYNNNKTDYAEKIYQFNPSFTAKFKLPQNNNWLVPKIIEAIYQDNHAYVIEQLKIKPEIIDLPMISFKNDNVCPSQEQAYLTAFSFACALGKTKAISAMLNIIANNNSVLQTSPDILDRQTLTQGHSPLILLLMSDATNEAITPIVKYMLESLSLKFPFNYPLDKLSMYHYAIKRNSPELLKMMLDASTPVKYNIFDVMFDRDENAPEYYSFDYCLINHQSEVLELLLKYFLTKNSLSKGKFVQYVNENKIFSPETLAKASLDTLINLKKFILKNNFCNNNNFSKIIESRLTAAINLQRRQATKPTLKPAIQSGTLLFQMSDAKKDLFAILNQYINFDESQDINANNNLECIKTLHTLVCVQHDLYDDTDQDYPEKNSSYLLTEWLYLATQVYCSNALADAEGITEKDLNAGLRIIVEDLADLRKNKPLNVMPQSPTMLSIPSLIKEYIAKVEEIYPNQSEKIFKDIVNRLKESKKTPVMQVGT